MNKITLTLITICSFLLTSGCKSELIRDLEMLEQNHSAYASAIKQYKHTKIPRSIHKIIDRQYNKRFFRPWRLKRKHLKKSQITWGFTHFKKRKGYGENKKKLSQNWVHSLEKNATLHTFPNFVQSAITIKNTNLRVLPTIKPHFTHFKNNGEGFPFDNLQNSAIAAGTPIMITHITKQKDWVFVYSPFAKGWINIHDIAYAGPRFRKKYQDNQQFVAITKENTPILSQKNHFLFDSNIGMIFPILKKHKDHYTVLIPQATRKRFAFAEEASISKETAHLKPMPLTINNIATLSNKLLNQPYGWGGLYHNRDCSAMIRDLFTPFGIWLPRNSKSQAKKSGIYFDLSPLSPKEKETLIINNGIPYLTLIWLPGHIMLYIGSNNNKAIVFHNIWGLRTKDELGRKIIGKSVITTLDPGKDVRRIDTNESLIKKVQGMTLLVPRYQP